ncbi:MAG: phosphoribosylanthranilate isomerase, partial [Proteobacteria bacterium]|nr:phosphoribosylanthranilate isomerase [Pseudomonadota bacterium]
CAVEAGADALGFVFFSASPRSVDAETAGEIIRKVSPFITTVGVFVDESVENIKEIVLCAGLHAVQLHGEESPEFVERVRSALPNTRIIKALRISNSDDFISIGAYAVDAVLLDTFHKEQYGGTGEVFDWDLMLKAKMPEGVPFILAGGLKPANIESAVKKVKPFAVDVSSGVETEPGKKDPALIKEFIKNIGRT